MCRNLVRIWPCGTVTCVPILCAEVEKGNGKLCSVITKREVDYPADKCGSDKCSTCQMSIK